MQNFFREDLLKNKVALISGGGSGICFEIARALGRHGAKVCLMGRREERLTLAARELGRESIEAVFFAGDVRELSLCEKAVEYAVQKLGALHILVNGAAGNFICLPEDLSSNAFRSVIDIDLNGTFHLSKAAFAALKKNKGVILNISATLQTHGTPYQAHAASAKAGVDALTRCLAGEWGEFGIRVVGLAPGPIADTEGMKRLAPLGMLEKLKAEIPLQRLGTKEEMAQVALFLVSDAAAYITGETLVADGGEYIAKPRLLSRADYERLKTAQVRPNSAKEEVK